MNWLSDIVGNAGSLIKTVGSFLGGNSIGSGLAKAAMMGFALNKVSSMTKKENDANKAAIQTTMIDPGSIPFASVVWNGYLWWSYHRCLVN